LIAYRRWRPEWKWVDGVLTNRSQPPYMSTLGNEGVHVLFCVSNQILWCALGQSRGWAVCNGWATSSRLCVCECVCVIRVCRGHYMSVLGVMAFYFQEREIDPAWKPKDTGTNQLLDWFLTMGTPPPARGWDEEQALLGLARTVYVRRIWPYIWWFPAKNIVCTPYIYGSGQP
jgi:hypothetical protein